MGRRGEMYRPISRAINVFPHPGGPYNKSPRTGVIPSCANNCGGEINGINIRRWICCNISSNPPIPNMVDPSKVSRFPLLRRARCARSAATRFMATSLSEVAVGAPPDESGRSGLLWLLSSCSSNVLSCINCFSRCNGSWLELNVVVVVGFVGGRCCCCTASHSFRVLTSWRR